VAGVGVAPADEVAPAALVDRAFRRPACSGWYSHSSYEVAMGRELVYQRSAGRYGRAWQCRQSFTEHGLAGGGNSAPPPNRSPWLARHRALIKARFALAIWCLAAPPDEQHDGLGTWPVVADWPAPSVLVCRGQEYRRRSHRGRTPPPRRRDHRVRRVQAAGEDPSAPDAVAHPECRRARSPGASAALGGLGAVLGSSAARRHAAG